MDIQTTSIVTSNSGIVKSEKGEIWQNRIIFIGLDIGTNSVGFAAVTPEYQIVKVHGKALWGIRLFEEAKTAKDRRVHRTSRRRLQRQKQRIELLQDIFADEIAKVDPGFYLRMKESRYWPEDKKDINGNTPDLPYALFSDPNFTDKDFYKRYPTIYHLRNELLTSKNSTMYVWYIWLFIILSKHAVISFLREWIFHR